MIIQVYKDKYTQVNYVNAMFTFMFNHKTSEPLMHKNSSDAFIFPA